MARQTRNYRERRTCGWRVIIPFEEIFTDEFRVTLRKAKGFYRAADFTTYYFSEEKTATYYFSEEKTALMFKLRYE